MAAVVFDVFREWEGGEEPWGSITNTKDINIINIIIIIRMAINVSSAVIVSANFPICFVVVIVDCILFIGVVCVQMGGGGFVTRVKDDYS